MRGSGRTTKQLIALLEKVQQGDDCLFIVQSNQMRDYVWRLLMEVVAPEVHASLSQAERISYSLSYPGRKVRLSIQTASVQPDRWRGVRLDKIETDHSLNPSPMQAEHINDINRYCLR